MDHTEVVRHLTFAPDGSLILVSASRDKTLRVWDLKDDGMFSGKGQLCYRAYSHQNLLILLEVTTVVI